MGKTFAEKIFAKKAGISGFHRGRSSPSPGRHHDLGCRCRDHVPVSAAGLEKSLGAERIVCFLIITPRIHFADGESAQDPSRLCQGAGNSNLYDVGEGMAHELMMAMAMSPRSFCVGTDSHTPSYGAIGAFSCGWAHLTCSPSGPRESFGSGFRRASRSF